MAFIAQPNSKEWDFIHGQFNLGMSIIIDRFYYLQELDKMCDNILKISLKDHNEKDKWTKWLPFPSKLLGRKISFGRVQNSGLEPAIDVHRSILPNEIVIESDYLSYEENYDAARIVGAILEHKGFIPHYYYSGSKSIHMHVFLDWDVFNSIPQSVIEEILFIFKGSIKRFKTAFIQWLRERMISCWDTKVREFDENLVKASHLIRAEMSRNKKGYKTFMGYTYKDMSPIPYICNEDNRIYPKIGKVKLSRPKDPEGLIDEFLANYKVKQTKKKLKRRDKALSDFLGHKENRVRDCVGAILSEDFKKVGDGHSRAMFILVNELRKVYGDTQARIIAHDWNVRMGNKVKEAEIDYRFTRDSYNLSCEYIHGFLKELGVTLPGKCQGKVYK